MVGFSTSELDALNRDILRTVNDRYPAEAKKFLRAEANKTRRYLRAEIKAKTTKRSGELLKGIKRGKVEKRNGDFQIRVSNSTHYASPLEHGHLKVVFGRRTGQRVEGRHFAATAKERISAEFPADADSFIDSLLERGLRL